MVSLLTIHVEGGRKHGVKTTPSMTVWEVIEDVCSYFGWDPKNYGLKLKRDWLDRTLPLRFSSIPVNAHLDLVPWDEKGSIKQVSSCGPENSVSVAIQFNERRWVKKISQKTTLWDLLEEVERDEEKQPNQDPSLTLTQRCDQEDHYLLPVCIFMNKEYHAFQEMMEYDLERIGLSSNGVIRLLFRPTEMTLKRAQQEIQTYKEKISKEKQALIERLSQPIQKPGTAMSVTSLPSRSSRTDAIPSKSLEHETSSMTYGLINPRMNSSGKDETFLNAPSSVSNTHEVILDRQMKIFRPPTSSIDWSQAIQLPDTFYDLTEQDARVFFAGIKRERDLMENAPLKTQNMRTRDVHHRLGKYPSTTLRIRFPDHVQLQAVFQSHETLGHVYKFVRAHLAEAQWHFELYTSPPKRIYDEQKEANLNFNEAHLSPATILNLAWKRVDLFPIPRTFPGAYLHASLHDRMEDITLPSLPFVETKGNDHISVQDEHYLPDSMKNGFPSTSSSPPPMDHPMSRDSSSSSSSLTHPTESKASSFKPKWLMPFSKQK